MVKQSTYTIPLHLRSLESGCLSDAGYYATALFGKWHLGDTQGQLPNDQGYDEWWGIMNSWDEAAYTSYSLFKETGVPVPMIWEKFCV